MHPTWSLLAAWTYVCAYVWFGLYAVVSCQGFELILAGYVKEKKWNEMHFAI